MMKIAGHTMGTPELTVKEAAALFSKIGLDAIEVIFQDGYKSAFNWGTTDKELLEHKKLFKDLGLEASCIVAYASDYNLPDAARREAAIKECRKCIEIAGILSAKYIRIYGGTFLEGDSDFDLKRKILVDSMRILAGEAEKAGVGLILENHFNTMTTGPAVTYDIVKEIDRENVGILYDQANICFLSGEDYQKCIELQKDKIFYVHVKDLAFKREGAKFAAGSVTHVDENERAVASRIVGEGILPWTDIVKKLHEAGYDGYLSLEYERRWHPKDLPLAEIGMKKSAEYLQEIVNGIK
jgi:sugar phosphate isomerase/epimerase